MSGTGSASGWAAFFWIAFERSETPMGLIQPDRTVVAVNDAFARVLGYSAGELAGRRLESLVPATGWKRMEADWRALRRAGRLTGERELIRSDGRRVRVQFAAHGEIVTGQGLILSVVLEQHLRPLTSTAARGSSARALTPRELEIVTKVALGRNAPEIARELHLATSTVKTHLRNAMHKVGAHSQAQLVAVTMAIGLLDPELLAREVST